MSRVSANAVPPKGRDAVRGEVSSNPNMRTSEWAQELAHQPALSPLFEDLDASCEWQSVAYEARPVLLAAAYHRHPRRMLVVTGTYEKALHWQAKLQLCGIDPELVCQMPSGSSALFEDAAPEHVA